LKILHITEKPRFSGAEILIRDLSLSHISQAEIAIASINPTEEDFQKTMQDLETKGIRLYIPNYPLSKINRLVYLFTVFKNFKPDVVVGHSAIVSAYMRLIGILFPKIKKVVVLHAAADYEGGGRLQKAEYLLQYFTDYVIGVSDWSTDVYKKRFFKVLSKTIYNGIELDRFDKTHNQNRTEIRKNLFDADENTFVILQVGRINTVKNQLLTLQAVSLLDDKIKQKLKIVFAGITEDKGYYSHMKEYIKSNDLAKQVIFLGARSDVSELLYASDLYVMPSERENFSIAILEALSTGIPVIYSDISQFGYLTQCNFEKSFKFNLKSLQEYSESIGKVIEQKISFTIRDLEDFSFQKCSQKYMELFKELKK
jgi:glycosyltransferase involved in cell wall biosynthesis